MAMNCLFHVTRDELNRAAGQAAADGRDWLYRSAMLLRELPFTCAAAILVDLDYCFDAGDFEAALAALSADCRVAVHGFNIPGAEGLCRKEAQRGR